MPAPMPAHVRARGELRAEFAVSAGRTSLMRLYEAGGLRLRCPVVGGGCEAVSINTGGGMAGGDTARLAYTLGPQARVTMTSQSAEKIYRADAAATQVDMSLSLGAGAAAEWLRLGGTSERMAASCPRRLAPMATRKPARPPPMTSTSV